MYDLTLNPILIQNGQQTANLIGFNAVSPPRRSARSRSKDQLVFQLTLSDPDKVSSDTLHHWLDPLTEIFYKTSGTVTAALRFLVETLNQKMMDRNLSSSQAGAPVTGTINIAALHGDRIYVVQSGWAHAYLLTRQGLLHFSHSSGSDRGLGFSRNPSIRYYQGEITAGGYFFMSSDPPDRWDEGLLLSGGFPNLEQLRRRLLDQAPAGFELGLIQIKPGSGQLNWIQAGHYEAPAEEQVVEDGQVMVEPSFAAEEVQHDAEVTPELSPLEDTQELERTAEDKLTADATPVEIELDVVDLVEPEPVEMMDDDTQTLDEQDLTSDDLEEKEETPESGKVAARDEEEVPGKLKQRELKISKPKIDLEQRRKIREKSLKGAAAFFDWRNRVRNDIGTFFKDIFARWSSKDADGSPKLPRKTMILIAVLVPLVIVAVAVGIYISRGRALQYESFYSLAEAKAQTAASILDPDAARATWMEAINFLDEAESYKETEESAALRNQARNALDQLDGAIRLRFHSALINTLPEDMHITRILSYGVDLYMLDFTSGQVIHAVGAGQGYQVDEDFICQAGNFSGGSIGALVDMVSLPPNNPYLAHILGIDASGNVMYCAPGENPMVQTPPLPSGVSGGFVRAAYENNTLYVLNPMYGTIYVYQPINGQFLEPPEDYFEGLDFSERPDLAKIVDIEVNGSRLYLLHGDGLISECISSGIPDVPVSCQTPVNLLDARAGREDQPLVLPGSNYVSILYNPPPDSTISILDAGTGDIYRFSQIFRLSKRLRPELNTKEAISTSATAFTIGMDRVIFLVYGNQVFFAYLD